MGANTYATVISLAIFFGVIAILAGILLIFSSQGERRIQRRLEGTDVAADSDFPDDDRPLLQGLARRGRAIDQLVDKEGESSRLLIQAGWRDTQSRVGYYVLQAVVPVVLVGLAIFCWMFVKSEYFEPPWIYAVIVGAVALSMLIPRMILRRIANARCQRIRKETPLFVHLLIMLYDAGLSTRQAFTNLVREGAGVLPELGREVQVVLRQIEAGADSSEALHSLSESLKVDDLSSVLGVMRQVDRYGGEIREPLSDALKVIEERQALDLRERVNVLSGRMTVVMVLFFFPGLMLFIAGPAFVSIIKAIKGL